MKNIVSLMGVIVILLTMSVSVFGGDIPNSYLVEDDAQVYFGEVKEFTNNTVTIIQKKNIKGEFKQDSEYTYERKDFTTHKELEIGKIYLCTVIPAETYIHISIWEVTSTDTKTLEVIEDHTFAYDMQQALNRGSFEKAEQRRLAKIEQTTQQDSSSTSVIGSVDETTDIVVTSNVNIWLIVGVTALVLLLVIVFIIRKKTLKNN